VKITFIVWTHYDRRPELVARQLGAALHYVSYGRRGRVLQAPLRYLVQAARTWNILDAERPDVVFVQNPPIFAPLVVARYARRAGARYVLDSHSGAFLSPKWRWASGLHRRLARGALTTIVQNGPLAEVVCGWGCSVSLLGFTPGEYPHGEAFPLDGAFNVAVISTYGEDEPLDVVWETARRMPDVAFYVTGDARHADQRLLAEKPENCHLTGYLSYERYIGLLRTTGAVIDLTTQDNTLLMGAYEAVALGTPLIVSDWPVLRDYFSRGAVHVPNTVEGLRIGIRRVQHERAALSDEMIALREHLHDEWNRRFTELQHVLVSA
jgi:glycosyltransferase involved in cell wall biosynthesis